MLKQTGNPNLDELIAAALPGSAKVSSHPLLGHVMAPRAFVSGDGKFNQPIGIVTAVTSTETHAATDTHCVIETPFQVKDTRPTGYPARYIEDLNKLIDCGLPIPLEGGVILKIKESHLGTPILMGSERGCALIRTKILGADRILWLLPPARRSVYRSRPNNDRYGVVSRIITIEDSDSVDIEGDTTGYFAGRPKISRHSQQVKMQDFNLNYEFTYFDPEDLCFENPIHIQPMETYVGPSHYDFLRYFDDLESDPAPISIS